MQDWFADTDPRALEVFLEKQRRMAPEDKVAAVFALTEFVIKASEAGVGLQYPQASEREVFLLAAARRLGRDLMIKAYGWDPEEYGRAGSRL